MDDIYDGKVYGLFEPLRVETNAQRYDVVGGTFRIGVCRKTGQVISAKILGDEYVADRSALPRPYIGIWPPDDPGATPLGGMDRPRYAHEKAVEIYPQLWSGGLNTALRYDAGEAEAVEVKSASPGRVIIEARGSYEGAPVGWTVEYDVDVDGFTKVTVTAAAKEPVLMRWNCFNHVTVPAEPVDFIVPWAEATMDMTGAFNYEYTRSVAHHKANDLVFGASVNPFFHLGNLETGIEFSKESFSDRWSGRKDTGLVLEDGRRISPASVESRQGEALYGMDSRGVRTHFTQVYRRTDGYEIEEFDVRDTTVPLNPGDPRTKVFWFQMTPPKTERQDLSFVRLQWPGPHQIVMARWAGGREEWSPPSDETVKSWAQDGVKLILGGANYLSGDYSHPTHPEKTRHFLEVAHKYGMKVIPYVTFSDWNMCAPGYQEHALDWANSSGTEFRTETTLMCFSAEGWREHFEREIDSLMSQFDFDGLYIDHWESRRGCTNERHGCGGYYLKYSTCGYHDMAVRARRVVARHTGGRGIILFNSGEGLSSAVLSMFDLRLMGENYDFNRAPETVLQSTYNDRRQGLQALVYVGRSRSARQYLNFVMTLGFPHDATTRGRRSGPEIPEAVAHYRAFCGALRAFGVDKARKISVFETPAFIETANPGTRVVAFARKGRTLLVVGYLPVREADAPDEGVEGAVEAVRKALADSGVRERTITQAMDELRPLLERGWRGSRAAEEPADEVLADTIRIRDPKGIGLESGRAYVVQDLLAHRYVETADPFTIPVEVHTLAPRVLVIEPAAEGPRVAHFSNADAMKAESSDGAITCVFDAVDGSPIEIYIDTAGAVAEAATPGFTAEDVPGGLLKISGPLPEDRKVRIAVR